MTVIRARCGRCRKEFRAELATEPTPADWTALVARYQFGVSKRAHSEHAKTCAGELERLS